MTIAPDDAQHGAPHIYRAMRDFVQSMDDTLPGKFEITKEGIVLEKEMPEEIVAHTGEPDGPRYATRKDFVYGEDVTIADWTISTTNLPLYPDKG
ncbi:hypothetical protein IQ62_15040 [Streptomyces scabiei]|uniref:hypothetical protein n=1 Tax=Streptomyces scabiei TaxID=1930 RepID=UPI0004E687D0|nr:hypothetical protein [Streptomyces scabiei]KFG00178.1 hypothetical protein IQ62_15040 [Streptomyces scabiei]